MTPLLEAAGLSKRYRARGGLLDRALRSKREETLALDDVSLSIDRGDSIGIVGESGSGKTTLIRSLVRLVRVDAGRITFSGTDVGTLSRNGLSEMRRRVQLIYQDPYSSLNPAITVGSAIAEPAVVHGLVDRAQARSRGIELMAQVGLSPALFDRRPRELSGGQRQRVAIARALAMDPEILLADEAVSALDVSIQAQILRLFDRLRRELGLTLVLVSHQLGTVAQLCDHVMVMYRGRVVEEGETATVFRQPSDAYTGALLAAQPGTGHIRRRCDPTR